LELGREGRDGEILDVGQHQMEAAHIIPFFLPLITQESCVMAFCSRVSHISHIFRKTDATRTWDMLRSWTQTDFETLMGSNIKSPMNAIYMTKQEHSNFADFDFFLEKESVSRFRCDLSLGLMFF
jgi:hypothetical protein